MLANLAAAAGCAAHFTLEPHSPALIGLFRLLLAWPQTWRAYVYGLANPNRLNMNQICALAVTNHLGPFRVRLEWLAQLPRRAHEQRECGAREPSIAY